MSESPASSSFRDELARRLGEWLDATLAGEAPPGGVDAELLEEISGAAGSEECRESSQSPPGCDQFALWSALIALTQEARLQGRAFDRLGETLRPLSSLEPAVRAQLQAGEQWLAQSGEAAHKERRRMAEEARRNGQRELLEPLLEVRERLARNLHSLNGQLAPHARRRRRFFLFPIRQRTDPAVAALREGCALSLARMEEILTEAGVQIVERAGVSFDPRLMQAVEITSVEDMAEGTVLEVLRPGYLWGGEVLRAAQVRVARRPVRKTLSDV